MIPEKLIIKGLYSYQDEQVIDFNNLLDAQLFGIFGGVGSGKSTILEAIMFALYAHSERLNQRDNRGYNMMNLKSNEMLIDFQFKNNQNRYRFVVQGKRNRNQFEKIASLERAAYQQNGNEWTPIGADDATEIIGLNYDNFRRTVIIPQGKFQEFLGLGPKDRTQMLKEIFNLDRFELFHQTARLNKRNDEKILVVNTQLEGLGEVDEEQLDALAKTLEEKQQERVQLQENIETKDQQYNNLLELKKQLQELEEARQNLHQLQEQDGEMQQKKQQLETYEYCREQFRELINQVDDLNEDIKLSELSLNENEQKYESLKTAYDHEKLAFEQLRDQYSKRDTEKERLDKTAYYLEWRKKTAERAALKERYTESRKSKDDISGMLESSKEQLKQLDKEIRELKSGQADEHIMADLASWWLQEAQLNQAKEGSAQRVRELEETLQHVREEFHQTNQEILSEMDITTETAPTEIENILSKRSKTLEEEKTALLEQDKDLAVKVELQKLSGDLEAGNPCPLCGATDHPMPLEGKDLALHAQSISERKAYFDQEQEELNRLDQTFRDYRTSLDLRKQDLRDTGNELELASKKHQHHLAQYQWDDQVPMDRQKYDTLLDAFNEKTREIAERGRQRDEVAAEREEVFSNLQAIEATHNQISKDMAALDSAMELLAVQWKGLEEEALVHQSEESIAQQIQAGKQRLAKLEEEYHKQQEQLEVLKSKISNLEGTIKTLRHSLERDIELLNKRNSALNSKLAVSKYDQLDEVKSILERNMDVQEERAMLQHYEKKVHAARELVEDRTKRVKGKQFDPEAAFRLENELKEMREEEEQLQKTIIRLEREIEELQRKLKETATLRKQLNQLENRRENLNTLLNMFRGSGFVQYASTVYLAELCHSANKRFYSLTRQRLQLELDEDGGFRVRDFLNDGKTRHIKTLSGGQTFQAALSLALALSDSVQRQVGANEQFFFLDEGFGSLDQESLRIVFDALKSLKKENRVVGVISHVDELQQEIDTYLKIINDTDEGSKVTCSWK